MKVARICHSILLVRNTPFAFYICMAKRLNCTYIYRREPHSQSSIKLFRSHRDLDKWSGEGRNGGGGKGGGVKGEGWWSEGWANGGRRVRACLAYQLCQVLDLKEQFRG